MSGHAAHDPVIDGLAPEMASHLFREFLATVPNVVYFKDADSRFVCVSDRKAARHKLAPAELVGKTDTDLFAEEHAMWARVDEESILATGEPVVGKLERTTWRDGREGWARVTKMPIRDDHGKIVGTFGITYDVTEQQRVALDLEKTRRNLMDASRLAGMAEIATGVLHNVGNVLTSLNVSANVLVSGLRQSKVDTLTKLAALVQEHADDLGAFVTTDPKGRRVPEFVDSLSQHMLEERDRLLAELTSLQQNIDHIKEIVTMQQSYATTAGVVEPLAPAELVEDALRMNTAALLRHAVAVRREFEAVPKVRGEKAKVLQILVNLIRNAKYACDDSGGADKFIAIRLQMGAPGRVQIVVEDNGVGIPAENLSKIFQHGFTTRSSGHGFGLHSARRAATEMGATLTAHSDGIGKGATFTLDLPVAEATAAESAA